MGKSRVFTAFVLLLISMLFICTWIWKIIHNELPYVDQLTRGFVAFVEQSIVFSSARFITEFGSASFLIPFTIIMTFILWGLFRDWLPALIFVGGTLGAHILNLSIKMVIARERPRIDIAANAEGYSFPSGHSMISMVCYGLLMYFLLRKIKSSKLHLYIQVIFALFIFLIGISRYIINVHYLTDVITGFIIGFIFLRLSIQLFERIQKQGSI